MKDYKDIFDKIESTLIIVGSLNMPVDQLKGKLDSFKHLGTKTFSDADYYWILVSVIFYSGFRAATVNEKLDLIRAYFPDYQTVANYDGDKVNEILADPQMIKNRRKVESCVNNALMFNSIVGTYGSFQSYIDSFAPKTSFENLMLFKEELELKFSGLGRITTYHVLTDIGMPVVKPDRVVCRIFKRLGLIESDQQFLKTVIHGRKFAQATGYPIRYIDIVFAVYGQEESKEFGLKSGICLEENPGCFFCGAKDNCNYYSQSITA
ncbi:MAG: DNA-3-methyladenine glycosylase I [Chloroflexi bacterium]|nr:DNA-3-methyladenine glycosylase I [Chloroflexota bacterium]